MKYTDKKVDTVIRTEIKEADGAKYKYELIMRKSTRIVCFKLPLYSIKIEMTDEFGEKTEAETGELFSDVGKAISFFEKLVKYLATPIDLAYIVEDELVKFT
jgi:hypothetical protein